jgi:hypothetical protein
VAKGGRRRVWRSATRRIDVNRFGKKEHTMGMMDDAKQAAETLGKLGSQALDKAAEALGTAAGTTARVASSITDKAVEGAKGAASTAADIARDAANRPVEGGKAAPDPITND